MLDYFFVTFSSFNAYFAIKKTTKAIITKLMIAPSKAPQPITMGPIENVAACQAPPGINGVIIGMIRLFTTELIRATEANPIINATASPVTLYSLKNSLNSEIIPMLLLGYCSL